MSGKARGRRPVEEITDPQRRTLRELRRFTKRRGFPPTIQELADILGISPPSVRDQITQLVRKGYVRRESRKARGLTVIREPAAEMLELRAVPIVGSVAAGQPVLAEENIIGEILVDSRAVHSGRCFALKVRGDSMIGAGIHDQDLVVVRQQPVAEHGDIVVALLDQEATCQAALHPRRTNRVETGKHRPPADHDRAGGRSEDSGQGGCDAPQVTQWDRDREQMTQFTMASLEEAGSAAREFWEDDLEMALDPILARVRENGVMDEWVGGRTGRQASVLCANLSIGGDGSVRERKNDLRAIGGDDLMPYLLVDQFSKFKSKIATIGFAKEVLTEGSLNTCRIKDDVFDKTALLFAMYHRRPEDLRVVFHLDKIHKSGFARMTLGETTRRRRESFEDFLQPDVVKGTLADFDVAKRDGRTSEFKDVVAHRDSQLVFIRRAERPGSHPAVRWRGSRPPARVDHPRLSGEREAR